jgi:peptide deformylase
MSKPCKYHPQHLIIGIFERDPILKQLARPVPENTIRGDVIHQMIMDMVYTNQCEEGLGLVGPQVFRPYQVMVIDPQKSAFHKNIKRIRPIVMINPELIFASNTTEQATETCLSHPGVLGTVERFKRVQVKFRDCEGGNHTEMYDGLIARIFQRGYDILQGIPFTEKILHKQPITETA